MCETGLDMRFNNGVMCVREGLDVVSECRQLETSQDVRSYPQEGAPARNSWHNWLHLPQVSGFLSVAFAQLLLVSLIEVH